MEWTEQRVEKILMESPLAYNEIKWFKECGGTPEKDDGWLNLLLDIPDFDVNKEGSAINWAVRHGNLETVKRVSEDPRVDPNHPGGLPTSEFSHPMVEAYKSCRNDITQVIKVLMDNQRVRYDRFMSYVYKHEMDSDTFLEVVSHERFILPSESDGHKRAIYLNLICCGIPNEKALEKFKPNLKRMNEKDLKSLLEESISHACIILTEYICCELKITTPNMLINTATMLINNHLAVSGRHVQSVSILDDRKWIVSSICMILKKIPVSTDELNEAFSIIVSEVENKSYSVPYEILEAFMNHPGFIQCLKDSCLLEYLSFHDYLPQMKLADMILGFIASPSCTTTNGEDLIKHLGSEHFFSDKCDMTSHIKGTVAKIMLKHGIRDAWIFGRSKLPLFYRSCKGFRDAHELCHYGSAEFPVPEQIRHMGAPGFYALVSLVRNGFFRPLDGGKGGETYHRGLRSLIRRSSSFFSIACSDGMPVEIVHTIILILVGDMTKSVHIDSSRVGKAILKFLEIK